MRITKDGTAREARERAYIAQARATWATDDLEIDDNPTVSHSDSGAWVAAWVYVTDESEASK